MSMGIVPKDLGVENFSNRSAYVSKLHFILANKSVFKDLITNVVNGLQPGIETFDISSFNVSSLIDTTDGISSFQAVKIGKVVFINFDFTTASILPSPTVLFTIPEGIRPSTATSTTNCIWNESSTELLSGLLSIDSSNGTATWEADQDSNVPSGRRITGTVIYWT